MVAIVQRLEYTWLRSIENIEELSANIDAKVGIIVLNVQVTVCVVGQIMRALGAIFTTIRVVVTFSMMFIASAISTDMDAKGNLGGIVVGSAVCITSILPGRVS